MFYAPRDVTDLVPPRGTSPPTLGVITGVDRMISLAPVHPEAKEEMEIGAVLAALVFAGSP